VFPNFERFSNSCTSSSSSRSAAAEAAAPAAAAAATAAAAAAAAAGATGATGAAAAAATAEQQKQQHGPKMGPTMGLYRPTMKPTIRGDVWMDKFVKKKDKDSDWVQAPGRSVSEVQPKKRGPKFQIKDDDVIQLPQKVRRLGRLGAVEDKLNQIASGSQSGAIENPEVALMREELKEMRVLLAEVRRGRGTEQADTTGVEEQAETPGTQNGEFGHLGKEFGMLGK
jgi:hypothetical protein